ncbi:MAG: AAA family ATPase [Chloroflexota bacterium]
MLKYPYAIRDFDKLISGGFIYLDRTSYIRVMEEWGFELLFMRPRRFGKSLWLSTLMHYYDLAKADDFERLFGHLDIGQNPTPLHNKYMVMRWDFSHVASHGPIEQIETALHKHVNDRITRFAADYRTLLGSQINIDPNNALSSFQSLLTSVDVSGHQLYLFIDEYDNFANEVMMASKEAVGNGNGIYHYSAAERHQRYIALVEGEGLFKTFFKNLKSAGSGDGLDRIFMTGVSPIVLNDVSSGANVFTDLSWQPDVNALCGFTADEVQMLVAQVVDECKLPAADADRITHLLENYYNGSRFVDNFHHSVRNQTLTYPKVYNPTLTFHFLRELQATGDYPHQMMDQNLVPDDSKLEYIGEFEQGKALLEKALAGTEPVLVETVRRKFKVRDLFNANLQEDALGVLLCYLGSLTPINNRPDNSVILEIPNLVIRKLYAERVLALQVNEDAAKMNTGRKATSQLFIDGDIGPLCDFVEENLLPIYDNRDAKYYNELTVKTQFMTLLYNNQLYLMDSEPELEQQYGDLSMLVRLGMQGRGLKDILIEFKYIPLSKVTKAQDGKRVRMDGEAVKAAVRDELLAVDVVTEQMTKARSQLQTYRKILLKKYQDELNLHTFVVVAVGMKRILWEELASPS